ncbi:MAG: phage head morphogenesis protein [Helicobacteraceae bacterium]|nr:phage head morphogenesis protein [Helicobacteraceae bacterium]
MVSFDFNLAPDEAMEYLKNKGFKLSFNYDELKKEAHHKAFTVAKVTRLDLLNDIHTALNESLKDGRTFEDFKKGIKPTLQKKGWWGEKDIVNPSTGEVKTINIGSRRLKTIFETNTRMAYNVAREEAMDALPLSVYRRYVSVLIPTTRDNHARMHGIIKHKDDEWWKTNSPLNGWGCKCFKTAHSKRDIEKNGWSINKEELPNIAHTDWAYDTRRKSNLSKLTKIDLDSSLSTLRTLKSVEQSSNINLSEIELQEQFYKTLGVSAGVTYIDKVGDPMIIDEQLFTSASGHSKIKKQDRHLLNFRT